MPSHSFELDIHVDRFQLARAFTISRGTKIEAEVLTATLQSGKFIGRGECVPYARYGETLESVTVQMENLRADLQQGLNRQQLQNALPPGAARNALDCALWDIQAKQNNTRIWDILGKPEPKPILTAYTLSLDEPDIMRKQAKQHATRSLLKIKLGGKNDVACIEAVRAGAPKSTIIVDANEGWDASAYRELAPELVKLGVVMVEQPLPASNDDALMDVERVLPVCADESCHDRTSLPSLIGKYDMINIKLDKTGGLTEALLLEQEAKAQGFNIMVGCMVGSSLAMAPATLIAQNAKITDLDGPLLLAQDRDNALTFKDNDVHPPKAALWG